MQAADRLRFAGELARIGDDQRPGARLDQRLGDRERRAPSPPAASGGAICTIVRPASGAFAPRPNGESALTVTRGFARRAGAVDSGTEPRPAAPPDEPAGRSASRRCAEPL